MKNKRISVFTYTVLLFSVTTLSSCNQPPNNNHEDIVILYENDAHCVIEGYSKLLRNDGMLDVEALERYVVDDLDGKIGQKYANTNINIHFI